MIITFNQMPTQITINTITGVAPFNIYLSDDPIHTTVYIATISTTFYVFNVPTIIDNLTAYILKVVDSNGCIVYENLNINIPQTPTMTPTMTPTPTPTPIPLSFTSVWRTVSYLESITLPYVISGTYSGTIDWGDGNTDVNSYANRTHTYDDPGDYTVTITGDLVKWKFNNTGDKLKIIEIIHWGQFDDGSSTNAFYGCSNLVLTSVTDIPNNLSPNLTGFFRNCTSITTINHLNSWNVIDVVLFNYTFRGCSNFDQDLGNWDMSGALIIWGMFLECFIFNNGGSDSIRYWDVSNVTNMNSVFNGCYLFNQPIGDWVTTSMTSAAGTFGSCYNFDQDLGNWNMSNVQRIDSMFFSSTSFNNGGSPSISGWTFSNSLTNIDQTFQNALLFNQPINNWERLGSTLSGVTSSYAMFSSATTFNQNVGDWNMSNNTNSSRMFGNSTLFNNGGSSSINNWDVTNITNMGSMFVDSSFDQPIESWNVISLTAATGMFNNTPISVINYDNLLVGWASLGSLLQPSVELGANGLQYTISIAGASRTYLNGTKLWVITGDTGI